MLIEISGNIVYCVNTTTNYLFVPIYKDLESYTTFALSFAIANGLNSTTNGQSASPPITAYIKAFRN